MFYFPSSIDNKIVKWYSDKGDYGYFQHRISYLAVVTYDEVIEVLFLSSTFNVLMSSECETEAEAMDVFDDPTKVKWHKKDHVSQHYRYPDNEYLTGYYNGRRYEFRVDGIPDNISDMINGQKSINVLFYEKSRSVKEISFNN